MLWLLRSMFVCLFFGPLQSFILRFILRNLTYVKGPALTKGPQYFRLSLIEKPQFSR